MKQKYIKVFWNYEDNKRNIKQYDFEYEIIDDDYNTSTSIFNEVKKEMNKQNIMIGEIHDYYDDDIYSLIEISKVPNPFKLSRYYEII